MLKIKENNLIELTRGDCATFTISTKDDEGNDYTFQVGDVVRFAVYKKGNLNETKLLKEVEVQSATLEVDIELSADDTKLDNIINKPVDYWYEVTLNPDGNVHTIIGYDDVSGAKIFRLYPEGVDD